MRRKVFTTQIGVPVPNELRDTLTKLCDHREIAMAEYIRRALAEALERDKQDLSLLAKQEDESCKKI